MKYNFILILFVLFTYLYLFLLKRTFLDKGWCILGTIIQGLWGDHRSDRAKNIFNVLDNDKKKISKKVSIFAISHHFCRTNTIFNSFISKMKTLKHKSFSKSYLSKNNLFPVHSEKLMFLTTFTGYIPSLGGLDTWELPFGRTNDHNKPYKHFELYKHYNFFFFFHFLYYF